MLFTANGWLIALIRACEQASVPAEALLAGEPLLPHSAIKPNRRIPLESMTRIWEQARKLTADPTIGLKTADFIRPTTFGALTMAIYASPSLREALEVLSRYGRLFSDAGIWMIREQQQSLDLVMMARARLSVNVIDAGCASIIRLVREITNPDYQPLEVNLSRPKPTETEPWDRLFRCPLKFQSGLPSLLRFPLTDIDSLLPGYDPEIYQQSKALIDARMASLNQGELTSLVRAQIMKNLHNGSLGLAGIAIELGIGPRTLQRHLEQEGQTFSQLLDNIRQEFAERYVAQSSLSFTDLAELLGFSSPASFSRAFQRWYAKSPRAYRKLISSIGYPHPDNPQSG